MGIERLGIFGEMFMGEAVKDDGIRRGFVIDDGSGKEICTGVEREPPKG